MNYLINDLIYLVSYLEKIRCLYFWFIIGIFFLDIYKINIGVGIFIGNIINIY